jgi:ligand-binding SRPBCC domain-containing protein
MVRIEERAEFQCPIERVFDGERDISLHSATQAHRSEKAVGGVSSGLIEAGQEVEWEAVHFGVRQRLRVRITHMRKPSYFRDEMVSGAFKSYSHEHFFEAAGLGRTLKRDVMLIEAPLGPLGWLVERMFLGRYMRTFLRRKNDDLRRLLESGTGLASRGA